MIEIRHVSKAFGSTQALRDISLDVGKGEILGLVGPDGAGKTTLIRLILGLFRQYEGQVRLFGSTDIEQAKNRLSYIPQRFSLYADLTVLENIDLIGALYGLNRPAIAAKAEEILRFTGLWPFRDRLAGRLSGGMKQKLSLASGLVHNPDIFFLDEPTTGVDPVSRREFWQLLYGLNRRGMSIVVATPYMDEAELCHRVGLISQGRIVRCESPADLISHYPYQVLELGSGEKNLIDDLKDCYALGIEPFGSKCHIVTDDSPRTVQDVSRQLSRLGRSELVLHPVPPSLEDVFVLFSQTADKGGDRDASSH